MPNLQGYALLLEAEGDLPGALAAIEKAVRIDPLRAANQNQRGLLLIASRDLPAARAAYQRMLEIDPENPRAYAQLAIIDVLGRASRPSSGVVAEARRATRRWLAADCDGARAALAGE